MRALRWLLVVPAAVLGWQIGAAPGAWAAALPGVGNIAVHLGVAVGTALALLLPALTAPSSRGAVLWSAFTLVVATASLDAWIDAAWSELAVVTTVGLMTLLPALRRWRGDGHARRR